MRINVHAGLPATAKTENRIRTLAALPFFVSMIAVFLSGHNAMATSLDFGISPFMTVVANQTVNISAEIINTSDTSLDFGCAFIPCGGLDFGAAINAGPGEGLNSLHFSFGSFYTQFAGLVLAPNEAFTFTFGTITVDPSLMTTLHPEFLFRVSSSFAEVDSTVSVGNAVAFSPPVFAQLKPRSVVPEPPAAITLGLEVCGFIMVNWLAIAVWRR